jgi:DMSO/TMAO reductase YedYZ heme-binding membrane subunit
MGEGTERQICRRAQAKHVKHGASPTDAGVPPAQRDVPAAENEESMARTKNNQRSANRVAVDVGATGNRPASKGSVAILAVCVLAAIWSVAMMTAPGRVAYYFFFIYAEFYMGVIALVSLSITIMIGLVATYRLVLSIRQRVLLQSTHRTTGVIAVAALFVHVWTKIVEDHIRLIDAFIPFLSPGNRMYVGFGTMSGLIMVLVMWTGIARSRFIGRGQPWMWRSIHAISYLMWPIALMHGLAAGRAAKPWVIVSYILCILLVLVGLAVRLSVSLNRKKDFSSNVAGGLKPVGKLVPTTTPAVKKRPGRWDKPEPVQPVPAAVVDTWVPAASPAAPVTAPPVAPPLPPVMEPAARGWIEDEMPMPAPRQRRAVAEERYEEPYEEVRPRGRRHAEDDYDYEPEPRPRARRYADEMTDTGSQLRPPELEDTSTRMRRSDLEDTSTRMRRTEMDDTRSFRPDFDEPAAPPRQRRYPIDEEPAPRARRRAEEPYYPEPRYDDVPRGRRHAEEPEYDDVPRPRAARYAADSRYGVESEDAPRARRDRGADIDRADPGRHSRTEFVDFAVPGDAGYLPPDDTPTLVDMASRRARKASQQDVVGGQAGRGARRNSRGRANDDVADDGYWSQLRGEAN